VILVCNLAEISEHSQLALHVDLEADDDDDSSAVTQVG